MKKTYLLYAGVMAMLLSQPLLLKAQKSNSFKKDNSQFSCPKFYLGLNMGLENPNGILGLSFDVSIIPHLSARTGIGLSSWGYKYYGEAVGYLGECHRSWAMGAGFTRNTGLAELKTTLPTTWGNDEVSVKLLPQTNMFFNLYHYFSAGKRKNRFYLQGGYSIPLSDKTYIVKSAHTLTDDGERVMKLLRPGGLSLGLGFYFNVSPSGR